MAIQALEKKYPAENEDIDTIITGIDGKDYVVDVIEGLKKWTPYLPEPDHIVIIEKILPPVEETKVEVVKKTNNYQKFISEMSLKLKNDKETKNLSGEERMNIIRQMWKESKNSA